MSTCPGQGFSPEPHRFHLACEVGYRDTDRTLKITSADTWEQIQTLYNFNPNLEFATRLPQEHLDNTYRLPCRGHKRERACIKMLGTSQQPGTPLQRS